MLGLTGKFTLEARQAMLAATLDAVAAGESQEQPHYACTNLLRTPSLQPLLDAVGVERDALFRDLGADGAVRWQVQLSFMWIGFGTWRHRAAEAQVR
jgi:hypothetical protein